MDKINKLKRLSLNRDIFEEFCSKRVSYNEAPWGDAIAKILGDYLILVDKTDLSLAQNLIKDGFWESWISIAIGRELNEGMNCVDVGANFGYYSFLMNMGIGKTGKVLAIEPIFKYGENILRSAKLNDIHNIEVCYQAISDKVEDLVELRSPGKNFGSTSMVLYEHPNVAKFYDKEGFKVYTNTIDNLCKDWEKVDFIKIDIEGAEELAWQGMQNTIKANEDIIIFMEYTQSNYDDDTSFLDKISKIFPLAIVDYDGNVQSISSSYFVDNNIVDWYMLALRRDYSKWTSLTQKGLSPGQNAEIL